MKETDRSIASTHWEACNTCRNFSDNGGCNVKEKIRLSLYEGNWILCDDYEKSNKALNQTSRLQDSPEAG